MVLWLIPLLPLIGAILPALLIRSGRDVCAGATGFVSLAALALLLSQAPAVFAGEVVSVSLPWVPQIQLSFSFMLDGLGFFFAAMILIIGLLVIVYARFYLDRADPMGRFYAYLLLFQGAMLGVVLSNNVILLLVFWELTSLTSFLLIGFWRHRADARQGARMALIVTGGGGLALIGGLLLLGNIAGSYEISEILARGDIIKASPFYLPALVLILIGAFTKSAQFPFHFWLPHAMAAPTPVSAYLHSATMVKAGIFLLARLWPALAGTEAWFLIVAPVGLATMVIGAWIANFRDDLKSLLAFSTVSHLGLVTMLLGLGTKMAAVAAVFHILNHATFKAALFLSAGIVDHEAGTRDVRRLGGLASLMPITATLAMLATASMAGVPFFNGFLSKEMMLEEAAHTTYAGMAWLFPVLATLGALLSVGYSARFAIRTFLGPVRHDYPHHPHDPPVGMWLPVALLIVPVLAIGLFPGAVAGGLVALTAGAVIGGPLPDYYLALWHGLTPALIMSAVAFAGGAMLFLTQERMDALRRRFPRPEAKALFEAGSSAVVLAARRATAWSHDGSLAFYFRVILAVLVATGVYAMATASHEAGTRAMIPVTLPALIAWLALVVACLATVMRHRDRLLALILTSVVGLIVALGFVQFSAPDLALTQVSVDVVTTILMLLALNLLPKTSPNEFSLPARWRDGAIAGVGGLGIGLLAYAVMTRDGASIADYFLAQSKPGGGGTNVVNVILVDFRGYDTFAEIIVLGIAAVAIFALLDPRLPAGALKRVRMLMPQEESGDVHPPMLVVAARALLPLALAVGVFIFLRGHNQPGGGFIAGLVVAIALMLQYVASGYRWVADRKRIDSQAMIGAGVGIAGLTGIAAWAFGKPFLTSTFGYFTLPVVGTFELASALLFDLGVFLTVVGVMVLSLAQLSRVGQSVDPLPTPEQPMDLPLDAAPLHPQPREA
ncbi:multisubunit potassium/proton antiporter PhaA subunit /multisubunit potassium/proton antiporter PhaB subunit [Ancylobacter aquaticus]|uniref:Multisubunit potassium/proton antiporter PhaA subunit /multisubunit potassium/proton antiporter PhaB subunit n=1 Tax=Ancylobacter aquaticus TaxID=100 RepID=A0A4R1I2W7_ANCAQ|nr:monovalent cation/H+ antiporter subunit A [Ancylobacter aquaticus]TCK29128.1 multisubunit potassium/proton antiporter PhaA subunit /multisubunit potassium/proton antiporter PhaB subunit [Ancylobacter aquaticus]